MAIIEKLLSETNAANVVGRDLKCRKPAPNILSALAVASSRPAQEILSNFIVRQTKIEQTGGSVAPCAIESLEVTHGVLNPSQQLFDTVYLMASQFGPPFKQTQFSSTAMLALGSLGRASIASREISPGHDTMAHDSLSKKASSLLQLKFREAVHLYAAHDYHYQKSRMQATQAFQRASLAMRNHFMASVRSLTRYETRGMRA